MKRQSPVQFQADPVTTEERDHWTVVREYHGEGSGPWLVDLSHKTRWDLQDRRIDDLKPGGLTVPSAPGGCRLENGILLSRMNATQAAVRHLGGGRAPELPEEPGYTDVSEASVLLALFGPGVPAVAEKLTALDFMDPAREVPFLLQGPFSHVPCQIVVLARDGNGAGAVLLSCSRGYARDMVHAITQAGALWGLRPAGEDRFLGMLEAVAEGRFGQWLEASDGE